jgi:cellulose biosynthesis protein BcsQ
MVNGENKQNTSPEIDSDLAKDVANLYSWANVEGASYRDFSRQRRVRSRHTSDTDIRKEELSPVPDSDLESVVEQPEAAAATPPAEESFSPPAASIGVEAVQSQPLPSAIPFFFEPGLAPSSEGISPSLAIYSLAGGVGKTTFCANLGRIFSSMKEKVLLVDASVSGLLPFYFGATDLKAGLRTFVAPDAASLPLQVIGTNEITKQWLEEDVKAAMRRAQRTIFDTGPASISLLPEILSMCGTVLVPLLPDLNSILTISRIEASFEAMRTAGRQVPELFYVFNQFDRNDSIDQRARTLVERQCGDRLLPLTVRESPEVARAIASRMTVADLAPGSAVTHDYFELATWVQKRAPVRVASRALARWSER